MILMIQNATVTSGTLLNISIARFSLELLNIFSSPKARVPGDNRRVCERSVGLVMIVIVIGLVLGDGDDLATRRIDFHVHHFLSRDNLDVGDPLALLVV